jgi:hypothetical protein
MVCQTYLDGKNRERISLKTKNDFYRLRFEKKLETVLFLHHDVGHLILSRFFVIGNDEVPRSSVKFPRTNFAECTLHLTGQCSKIPVY